MIKKEATIENCSVKQSLYKKVFLNVTVLDLLKNVFKNKRDSVYFSTVVGVLPATLLKNELGETGALGKSVRFHWFSMSIAVIKNLELNHQAKK